MKKVIKQKKKNIGKSKEWKNYEQVTEQLLKDIKEHLGLNKVEPKNNVKGDTNNWEIDVCAYDAITDKLVVVECKCWSSRVGKQVLTNLYYSIKDTGAERGIIVTTLGLQRGAKRIAEKEKIASIILRKDSDIDNYVAEFINNIFVKITNDNLNTNIKTEIKSIKELKVEVTVGSTKVDCKVN